MRNMAVLVASVGFGWTLAHGAVSVQASAASIDVGSMVTLTWATDSYVAFINGVGQVDGSGSITLTPLESTEYIVVAAEHTVLASARVRVVVRGARGSVGYPDLDEFRDFRSTGDRAGIAFA